jgi:hypothetical protein
MAKAIHTDALDALLDYIKTNGLEITLCGTEPTDYTEAHTTYMLAAVVIDSSDFTGPATGDVSGRKVTIVAQSSITPDAAGTANFVCINDTVNSKLLAKTTCPAKAFDTDDLVNIASFKVEVADPT